jgi:hypothetical protein
MFAGMMKAAQAYVSQVGATEASSKGWLLANQSIEESVVKIGRAITTSALPYLQQAAGIIDNIANTAEKSPAAVDAALKVAAGGTLMGGALGAARLLGVKGGGLGVMATGLAGVGLGVGINDELASDPANAPHKDQLVSDILMGLVGGFLPAVAPIIQQLRKNAGVSDQVGFVNSSQYAGALAGGAGAGAGGAMASDPLK